MKQLVTAIIALFVFFECASASPKPRSVIAYYAGRADSISKYPLEKLSHVIYCFLHLRGNEIAFDTIRSEENFRKITALKSSYPKLKVMLSLGGWGGCYTCSDVFSNADNRKQFAASVLRILKSTGGDGIDLDWEYPTIEGVPGHPCNEADKQNFTELIKELRSQLGKKYEISFAAGGFTKYLEKAVDWKAVTPLVNRINLMTYDLVSGYSQTTGHHTALYSTSKQKESTDHCVSYLLQQNVPAKKLVIGAAFYARVWGNVDTTNNGLYRSGNFKAMIPYKWFNQRLSADSGYTEYWDSTANSPYKYNAARGEFATYDNEKSILQKVRYAKKYKLGGIMFWDLRSDTYQNGLLDAIANARREKWKR